MAARRVLVVEDNPLTRGFLREVLQTGGFEVVEAETGHEAVRLVAEARPRLILQDMGLPDMDGIELLGRIRRVPGGDVPVVALSGLPQELQRAQDDLGVPGFTDYLEKPISGRALLLAVESHIGPPPDVSTGGDGVAGEPLGAPARVVVVDCADSLGRLGMRLEQAGHTIVLADDGAEALAEIRARPPAAVACAALVPGLDGFSLCRAVRGDPATRHVPVVLFSDVFAGEEDRDLARQCGASSLRFAELEDVTAGLAEALAGGAPPPVEGDEEAFARRLAARKAEVLLATHSRLRDAQARVRFQDASLSLLGVISESLHESRNADRDAGDLLARCLTAAGSSLGAAFLRDAGGRLALAATLGFRGDAASGIAGFWGRVDVLERVAENGVPLVIAPGTVGERTSEDILRRAGARSMLVSPLGGQGEIIGVLVMASHRFDLADWVDISRAVSLQIGQALQIGRALRRLAHSEASQRAMFEGSVLGIYRTDASGRFVAVNPALAAMLGYPSTDALLGVGLERIYRRPDERARLLAKYRDAERFEGLEVDWVRSDGVPVTVRLTGRRRTDASGAHAGFEVFVEDITGRREMEQEVRQAQRLDALRRLAGGVAHEYRNLLTAIAGHAELLEGSIPEGDPRRHHVDAIRRAAGTAEQVTRDLQTFSRRSEGTPRVVDLDALVDDALSTLRRVLGGDVELRRSKGERPPLVLADPGQMEQVLVHLAVHARDAMPRGGTFSVETGVVDVPAAEGPDGPVAARRFAVLETADTGPPLDAEQRVRLLEPRFDAGEGSHGDRLGLAWVYGMVRQSGGQVSVRPGRPGEGSRIRILLPLADAAAGPATPSADGPAATVVLVAEDEEAVRSLVSETLRREGYEVLEAANGEEGLHRASQHAGPLHLLVTDVVMPRMGGRRLAEALRAVRPDLPVLFVSGYTEYGGAGSVEDGGTEIRHGEFLQKPFTPRLLAARVKSILGGGGSGEGPAS